MNILAFAATSSTKSINNHLVKYAASQLDGVQTEILNINDYDVMLYSRMKARLLTFCDSYRSNPDLYAVHNEEALKYRYRYLQLRDTSELRLNSLCSGDQDNGTTPADHTAGSE